MARAAAAKVLHNFARLSPIHLRHAPVRLHTWLGDSNSLSARLATLGSFSVKLIAEHHGNMSLEVARIFAARVGAKVLIRQVELQVNQQSVVAAQSLLPISYLKADKRKFYALGSNSLGHWLFSATSLQRQHLGITQLPQQHQYANSWGRSQLFVADGLPLIVSEFFLPALFTL